MKRLVTILVLCVMGATSVFAQQKKQKFKGSVYGRDAQTEYEVEFVAGRYANVTLLGLNGASSLKLYVYDPKGYLVARDDSMYSSNPYHCRFLPSKTGKYSIVIESYGPYNPKECFFILETF